MSCWKGVPGGDPAQHPARGLHMDTAAAPGCSQPPAFLNSDSILINITSHKADMAAAEILQHKEEKKKKRCKISNHNYMHQ